MRLLIVALIASQTAQPVKIVNPENQAQGLGGTNPLKVNCVSGCSAGASVITVDIQDAGHLHVELDAINANLALIKAKTDNLDVTLSTRTKPADQQHVLVDSALLTDTQLRATPVPVSGTVTTTPPSNASTNVSQVNAQTVNVGTGAAGTGTQRVAVASDSAITANAGTNLNTSALALDATLTNRTQKSQITDGTRDGTVKAASTASIATDTSLVVALSPNTPLPAGTAVIGHIVADTGSTTAVTGNVTVTQATGTNLHAVLDTTSTTAVTQATAANLNAAVVGTKTNNNAAPGATNVGALGAVANASAPSWTEGNLVASSVDLSGRQRTDTSSWLGSTAPSVGQKTSANSIPVVLGSDNTVTVGTHAVTQSGTWTSTATAVAAATTPASCTTVGVTSTTVLASQAGRKDWTVIASPANTFNCFFRRGATALVTDLPLVPGQAFTDDGPDVYTGVVDAICAAAAQTVCVGSL